MYHYTESGLSTVWLTNGYYSQTLEGDTYTSVEDVNGLHRLIAKILIGRRGPLDAGETRFLRIEMNMSQKALAELMGVDVQTLARWEKGHSSLPRTADVALRALYTESREGESHIGLLMRMLADAEINQSMEKLVFEERDRTWQQIA